MNEKISVLIADDHQTSRMVTRIILNASSQIEVIGETDNGQDAVALAHSHKPQVVLMDVQMPLMNGLEATKIIKTTYPDIKVIVMSSSQLFEREALLAGADLFLPKDRAYSQLHNQILLVSGRDNYFRTTPLVAYRV